VKTAGTAGSRRRRARRDPSGAHWSTLNSPARPSEPGTFIHLPRGVPHSYRAGDAGGEKLILAVPGGLEAFFAGLADVAGGPTTMDQLREVHGITMLP